ncbi:MAG: glutamate 5-kinase [Candidatus Omnitrophota bacterium]|nr:glutamate 5-kinase [Candidatus Omnitrophota bacterium]
MKTDNRIVVKVGTKVITSKERALDKERIKDIVRQIAHVQRRGTNCVLVTSGAIGAGMWLLDIKRRPQNKIAELQAIASIGQCHLMQLYSELFKERGFLVGQILLTQEDFNDRKRYLNIKHTIDSLFAHNVIPIINENDTVAIDEIKCGDNDRLSGLVADLCGAAKLVLLTDVDGLLDEKGNVISRVSSITANILKLAGKSACDLGTGGMATKIESARNVIQAGIACVIANGRMKDVLIRIMDGEVVGTAFETKKMKFVARKRWIAFSPKPKGVVRVDEGAKIAMEKRDKSLLASGIVGVEGDFVSGNVISIFGSDGREFARGIAGYSSGEISKIKGLNTGRFKETIGYKGPDEVIHKDDLVIL